MDREAAERRARRLLRWYPKAWRQRCGEEFTELLVADIDERPRSWRRTLDVARRGLAVRVTPRTAVAGLVLLASLAVCVWIGTYTVPVVNVPCDSHCTSQVVFHLRATLPGQTPGWAIPLAIAVGLGGAGSAFRIYRPRRTRT